MKQMIGPVMLGVACFGVVAALIGSKAGEGGVWAGWLYTTAVAGFLAGCFWPTRPLRAALGVMLTQPPCMVVGLAFAGEITNPGSSTGGLVAVGICSMLLFLWTPVPLLLSWVGARVRRRADAPVQAPRP